MQKKDLDDEPTGLFDRLLAAILAPLFFNIALVVVISEFYRDHWFHYRTLSRTFTASEFGRAVIVISLAAAIAGFCLGTKGYATFLGHAFLTNPPSEQSVLVTVLIWGAIAALGYYLATVI